MKTLRNLVFIFITVFLFFSLTRNLVNYRNTRKFYESNKEEYEKEKKENITLKTHILKKQDAYEVEKTIRNKLNLMRPDEVTVLIPTPTPTPFVPTPTPQPVYVQWVQVFFGN